MDHFNALPFPQKTGVLAFAAAALGGLFFYALIMPEQEVQAAAEIQKDGIKTEIDELKKKLTKLESLEMSLEELDKRSKELTLSLKGFEDMLPRAREMEQFVTGISEMARNAGLELISFKKGKLNHQDFYFEVPIEMEVTGTYRELIGFMRTVSEKDRRAINIRDLVVTREDLPVQKIVRNYERRRKEETPEGVTLRTLDPAAKLMQMVRAHEDAIRRGVKLGATFTAYVFSYTGKPADKTTAATNKGNQQKRDQKRKEVLAR